MMTPSPAAAKQSVRFPALIIASLMVLLALSAECQAQRLDRDLLTSGSSIRKAFRPAVADARLSMVRVRSDDKDAALGVIVDSSGYVLTKLSELNDKLECRLQDGKKLSAEIVGVHRDYDLAMLKIDAANLKEIEWVTESDAPVGSWLATAGLDEEPIAVGVVSVARRKIERERAVLGIQLVRDKDAPTIETVYPNSGADRAGLKVDDVIVRVAGKAVETKEALLAALQVYRPGETLDLLVRRGEEEKSFRATLGDPVATFPSRANLQNQLGGRLSGRRTGFDAVLQHDTVLRPQDCGGVVVNLEGYAVGLNIARAGRIESYAIPAPVVVKLLDDLKSGKLAPEKLVTTTVDDEPAPPALPE